MATLTAAQQAVVDRAFEISQGGPREPLTPEDRSAMRAFLQRAETRLSTYQRVAGVFLNGAGLLVLLPAVAQTAVQGVLVYGLARGWTDARAVILIPLSISLALPLYALVSLLRDLVEFYFAPKFVSGDPISITRFSLAGLSFPYDEGIEAKASILADEVVNKEYEHFILGAGSVSRSVEEVFTETKAGNIAYPIRRTLLRRLQNDASVELTSMDRITVAFAMAGSLDDSLSREVARAEASLARHVLTLRRLVLRYAKALILFVWTTLVTILVVSLLSKSLLVTGPHHGVFTEREQLQFALYAYLVWALSSLYLVRLPRFWINRLASLSFLTRKIQDNDIKRFENNVTAVLVFSAGVFVYLLTRV
jgi:hypothetical protein